MGLDMYLEGRKSPQKWVNGERVEPPKMDGFTIGEIRLELGYWRKHANLHGYIVQTFAEGVDDCSPIFLDTDKIDIIIDAIKNKKLPHTEGFFFGASDGTDEEAKQDIEIFTKARAWLAAEEAKDEWRSVQYQASW